MKIAQALKVMLEEGFLAPSEFFFSCAEANGKVKIEPAGALGSKVIFHDGSFAYYYKGDFYGVEQCAEVSTR